MRKIGWVLCAVALLALLSGCALLFGSLNKTTSDDVVFWDSTLLQNVTRLTEDGLSKDWAKVSPDGTKMLYCESSKVVQQQNYGDVYNYWNIVLLRDVRVPAKTPLINDYAYAPAWYEDNNKFLYVSNEDGNSRIVRTAAAGGGKTYVNRNAVGKYDTRPSIRREVILCDTFANGKRQLVSMKDNGTEVTFLGDGHSPSWHPTQPKFVFIRNGDVYEMDLANIQVTQLYSDDKYNCASPSYSANGQYIVFQKGAEVKSVGITSGTKINLLSTKTNWQIFTMKADGTSISPLTFGSVASYSPSWDINNNIYFISSASGKTEIYRAKLNLN